MAYIPYIVVRVGSDTLLRIFNTCSYGLMLIVGIAALRLIPLHHEFHQNPCLFTSASVIFNSQSDNSIQDVCAIFDEDDSREDETLSPKIFKFIFYPFSLYNSEYLAHPVAYHYWETFYDSITHSNYNTFSTSLPLRSPPCLFI